MEDDDEDLRAALELSLHPIDHDVVSDENDSAAKNNRDSVLDGQHDDHSNKDEPFPRVQITEEEDPNEFNFSSFQKIMWDDVISTINDKERWVYGCISTGEKGGAPTIMPLANPCVDIDAKSEEHNATPLEFFTGNLQKTYNASSEENVPKMSHEDMKGMHNYASVQKLPQVIWGLTQKHGGPCGVLAAIQAELIRILLFGRKNDLHNNSERINKTDRKLVFPFSPSDIDEVNNHAIKQSEVDESLAMAVGMILARASIAPSASNDFRTNYATSPPSVRLVLPMDWNAEIPNETSQILHAHNDSPWIREILYSTTPASPEERPNVSSGLKVYTITIGATSSDEEHTAMDDTSPEIKRQRKKGVTFSMDSVIIDGSATMSPTEKKTTCTLAYEVADFLLGRDPQKATIATLPLDFLKRPGGVLYFVMSLVKSRGIEKIKSATHVTLEFNSCLDLVTILSSHACGIRLDMDDPSTTITSQFGHSSQELINLLLTGQAVSNVFDNSMTVSGEFQCRGIQRRPAIGYLSQLESLRYCEVGSFYKTPLLPIWIIGSTSHFSVIFGDDRCLKESKSDQLLDKCRMAFKKVENGGENGFIVAEKLGAVIDELDLRAGLGGDDGVNTLQAFLEVSGAGIILWDDFWKSCSRLLSGASLEAILQHDSKHEGPPLMITQFGEGSTVSASASASADRVYSTIESDEELAKKLAAEWGTSAGSMEVDHVAKSDEELARELQAQWDAEIRSGNNVIDLTNQDNPMSPLRPPSPTMDSKGEMTTDNEEGSLYNDDDATTSAQVTATTNTNTVVQSKPQTIDFETSGVSFPLYHYNGLRGGCLTPFRVTRLSPEEAVGASIALSTSGNGPSRSGSGDLEDVVRTKWPSCIINWLGKEPPYID
ncbi:LOW QUALITY PROTEIN: hypothetical protein ACHAXS_010453 [Conticribra weissflogii]